MKNIICLLLSCSTVLFAYAQNTITIQVKDKAHKEPVPNATVSVGDQHKVTAKNGTVTFEATGTAPVLLTVSHVGLSAYTDTIPYPFPQILEVFMEGEEDDEMEEVVVQSLRTHLSLANTPTRVEIVSGEELDEKNNMRPANVSMLMHENIGLQLQQVSATTANASVRVQGLDGRYTQFLKDGYPNFGNFAGGLSILEIPPLDLKQVEIIKGPASTLYGGGAIAGAINFISKTPEEEGEHNLLLNASNVGQMNAGIYSAKKLDKIGYTVLAQYNRQKAYDVDKDHFSELPASENVTIHPRLFFYPGRDWTLQLGNSFTASDLNGGDMNVISGNPDAAHTYFEKNETGRNNTNLEIGKAFGNGSRLLLRQNYGTFSRKIAMPSYLFEGKNKSSYTDATYTIKSDKHTIISGLNLMYDDFQQQHADSLNTRSATPGVYVQHTWDAAARLKLETGLRYDYARLRSSELRYDKRFLLPRVSALVKWTDAVYSRIGFGMGYKLPTIFTEQTEALQYREVLPVENVVAEQSTGTTVDINYKVRIGDDLRMNFNQLFFLTQIDHALQLRQTENSFYYVNRVKPVVSKGFETNLQLIYRDHLKLFAGYAYTYATNKDGGQTVYMPLVSRNKLSCILMYEEHGNFRLGLEGYHTGKQYLTDKTRTPDFWEFGFMAEKTLWKHFSFYINFENFTDTRQSKYAPVMSGTHAQPRFAEIWTHTEGFVWNGGVKIRL